MMTHEHHDNIVGAVLHHDETARTSKVDDNTVCERAPTGRQPLNYLPREAARSMRVSQRRAATS